MTAGHWFIAAWLLLGVWSPFLIGGAYWLGLRRGRADKSCTKPDEMQEGDEADQAAAPEAIG